MGRHAVVAELTPEEVQAFWAQVERGDGCWTWLGERNCGFALWRPSDRPWLVAHRVARVLAGGDPAEQVRPCPRDRFCVNPDHIRPQGSRGWIS